MPLPGLSQTCMMRFTATEVQIGYQKQNTHTDQSDKTLRTADRVHFSVGTPSEHERLSRVHEQAKEAKERFD